MVAGTRSTTSGEEAMAGSHDTARKGRAARFRIDPRLVIGVLLVVASVAGVYAIVTAADRSALVYSATGPLAPGERVYPADLGLSTVRLGDSMDHYLKAGDVSSDGVLITRAIAAGELIPASAVGSPASLRLASVVVGVNGQLSKSIAPGAVVDVWASPTLDDRMFGPPTVLVGSATVVRVLDSSGIIANDRGRAVELLIPRDRIARVLEAIADESAVSLVPVSIPMTR